MTGFKPRTSGIGSDRSTNRATILALMFTLFNLANVFPLSGKGDAVGEMGESSIR